MKKRIAEELKTKYKSFGLSNEAIDRIASATEKTVTSEDQIADAIANAETMALIAGELQRMRDTEIQRRTDLQREHEDYKAKHPEDPTKTPPAISADDIKTMMKEAAAEAAAAAVASVKGELDEYKKHNAAQEAATKAHEAFFGNKWTEKFPDEASDAWERVSELNNASGNKMTAEEMSSKATEFFNKVVTRTGVDPTKPFEEGQQTHSQDSDFSDVAKILEDAHLIEKEKES